LCRESDSHSRHQKYFRFTISDFRFYV